MIRIHYISMTIDRNLQAQFSNLGLVLHLEDKESRYLQFSFSEEDSNWQKYQQIVQENHGHDSIIARFTQSDIENTSYMEIGAIELAWPQPKREFGFEHVSYDLTDFCKECGIGAKQVRPFLLKKEPSWRKNSIGSLVSIHDELFVTPQAWATVFSQFGVDRRTVMNYKTGEPLETVVQLDIHNTATLKYDSEQKISCSQCGRIRFDLQRDEFKPPPMPTDLRIFKSEQWFGTGHGARKYIYIHRDIYRAMKACGIRGAIFTPCPPDNIALGTAIRL